MCDHKNLIRLNDGWFCLDCKTLFADKPQPPKDKPKKTKKKGAEK